MSKYYITHNDRNYELRQLRFLDQPPHPHDLCGVGRTWDEIVDMAENVLKGGVDYEITCKVLWDKLGDTPTYEDEEGCQLIDIPFLEFRRGTDREEIWRWFEGGFGVNLESLMFLEEKQND